MRFTSSPGQRKALAAMVGAGPFVRRPWALCWQPRSGAGVPPLVAHRTMLSLARHGYVRIAGREATVTASGAAVARAGTNYAPTLSAGGAA